MQDHRIASGGGEHGLVVKLAGGGTAKAAVVAGSIKPGEVVTLGIRPEHLREVTGGDGSLLHLVR